MTPRTVVKAAPASQSVGDFFEAIHDLRFSRIPLYEYVSLDQVLGYVLKVEMLAKCAAGELDTPLVMLKRDIIAVAEDSPILDLFNKFLAKREHIALVTGGFGGMAGIVTMEDVIETLIGVEIVDESDRATDMRKLARENWERRARRLGLTEQAELRPNGEGRLSETE